MCVCCWGWGAWTGSLQITFLRFFFLEKGSKFGFELNSRCRLGSMSYRVHTIKMFWKGWCSWARDQSPTRILLLLWVSPQDIVSSLLIRNLTLVSVKQKIQNTHKFKHECQLERLGYEQMVMSFLTIYID